MEQQELFEKFVRSGADIFGKELVGIYLHGSMAMGCFNPAKSDIDLLLVTDRAPLDSQKKAFMDILLVLNDAAPAKGIEMSLVRYEYCKNFVYPTPFELHLSNAHQSWYRRDPWEYVQKMKGVDYDLAAHFFITKNRGMVLYGRAISEVFGEIPAQAYLDSIRRDVLDSQEAVMDNPIYVILNLCRVLAYTQDQLVLSKKEGGEWGIKNAEAKFQGLIKEALECYLSDKTMIVNPSLALEYCNYMEQKLSLRDGKC